jgi:hypothetical protein
MQLGFLEEKKIVNKLWQFLLSPVESRIVKPNTVILEDMREFRIQLKLVHKIIFTHNVSNPSGFGQAQVAHVQKVNIEPHILGNKGNFALANTSGLKAA